MMSDQEKVIKGLNHCFHGQEFCDEIECPYYIEQNSCYLEKCQKNLKEDILSLLKEQKAKIEQLNRFVNGFSLDAMPVVRCKNCKHATMTSDGKMCKYCEMDTDDFGDQREVYHDADWFCADGERADT